MPLPKTNNLGRIVEELKQKGISFDHKHRLYISTSGYITKFHPIQEEDRVNRALSLQETAYLEGFPTSLPISDSQRRFVMRYKGGFITSEMIVEGEQLDEQALWPDEISNLIFLFYEFQKGYTSPEITHCRKGLRQLSANYINIGGAFDQDTLDYITLLSSLDSDLCQGDSIIHGDILPKNIIRTSEGRLILIDFEKVMRGSLEVEVASSIFYSFMGARTNLKLVYQAIMPTILKRCSLSEETVKKAIAHKSAEYLIQKKIDIKSGKTKPIEAQKALKFLNQARAFLREG